MQEQIQGFTGVWIPKEVLNSTELTPSEKILYANIASFPKACFETNERLAGKCGVAEPTISRSLKKLQKKKFIFIEFVNNDSSKRRIYAIMDNPEKLAYLAKKGLFSTGKEGGITPVKNKSFPQGNQNDDPVGGEGNQNDKGGNQNDYPQNRGEGNQNDYQRKKEEKRASEQKPNLTTPRAGLTGDSQPAAMVNRPLRKNFSSDEEFEHAFYAWNRETRCVNTS